MSLFLNSSSLRAFKTIEFHFLSSSSFLFFSIANPCVCDPGWGKLIDPPIRADGFFKEIG